jgi:hypothetical protein
LLAAIDLLGFDAGGFVFAAFDAACEIVEVSGDAFVEARANFATVPFAIAAGG